MFPKRKYILLPLVHISCLLQVQQTVAQKIQKPLGSLLPQVKNKFIVVAHRGSHQHVPENTLEAFDNAIKEGADYVEIDLRSSKDNELVIMHDATVDRMTTGKGAVKEITLTNLKKLQIRSKREDTVTGCTIPAFREVLNLCKDKINIYLDFKDADPATAYAQILEYGMEKQIIVYINNEKQFYGWRKVAPSMPLMISIPDTITDETSLKIFLDKTQPEIIDGDFAQYTKEMVAEANRNGCFVLPDIQDTADNPDIWNIAIEKGIKGLQTDHPLEMISYLKKNNLR